MSCRIDKVSVSIKEYAVVFDISIALMSDNNLFIPLHLQSAGIYQIGSSIE